MSDTQPIPGSLPAAGHAPHPGSIPSQGLGYQAPPSMGMDNGVWTPAISATDGIDNSQVKQWLFMAWYRCTQTYLLLNIIF